MPTQDYKVDGKRVSGVTTIISGNLGWNRQQLMYWAWEQGREGKDYRKTSEAAASAGTIAHAMIEAELKGVQFTQQIPSGTESEILSKAETAYLAWLEWKGLVDFQLLGSEVSLVSVKHGFGGTIDVAAVKKRPCILDLKTSGGVYPDHLIQLAAYGELWNENHPEQKIEGYYLLRLGKEDGSFHYHYWPSLPTAWEAFLCLLRLHELKKKIKP